MAFVKIPESTIQVKLVELTDNCIDKIADAVVRKLADRKTENSSEIPNNCKAKNYCDDCLYTDTCDSKEFFYACTSKATISKMGQVETMSCQECKHWDDIRNCWIMKSYGECHYEPKDEPQTERSE